ncbi:MAG: hypothetical protein JWQ03_3232 [Variovorax sp.]|nr:hypothetical protein [Variovorax sp.]
MTSFKDVKFALGGTGLRGLDEALALLDKIVPEVKANLQEKLEHIAAQMVSDMKGRVPVESGALRDSIRWFPAKKKPGVIIQAGGSQATLKPSKGGFRFEEVLGIEYGTTKMRAQPFFYPVVEAHRSDAENAAHRAVDEISQGQT